MKNRQRIVIVSISIIIVGLVVWYAIVQVSRIGKIPVSVETAPEDTTIQIDGKKAQTGTNYITPSKHTFVAQKKGYETTEKTATVDEINNYIAILLAPISDEAIKESSSSLVAARAESISGAAASASGEAFRSNNPIVSKLPMSDIAGPYKIDYGYVSDAAEKIYLVVSYSTPDGRQKALRWLKSNNVNTATHEIIFEGYTNPVLKEGSHD